MIKIYALYLFTLTGLLGYGQISMTTFSNTVLNNKYKNAPQEYIESLDRSDNYQFILLAENQKSHLINSLSFHLKDSTDYFTGHISTSNKIINNSKIFKKSNNKTYYIKNKKLKTLYTNDSIIIEEEFEVIDSTTGELIYDQFGDQILEVKNVKYPFKELLFKYSTLEEWSIKNNKFNKHSLLNSFYIPFIAPYQIRIKSFSINPHKKSKTNKQELIKNINYNYLFFPYSKLIENSTENSNKCTLEGERLISSLPPYSEEREILIRNIDNLDSRSFHDKDYSILVKKIIENMFKNKFSIVDLNTNKKIGSENLKNLFLYENQEPLLDEFDEYIYDELGDLILINTNKPYNYSDIIGLQFNEDWYLAKNQFDIVKKVNSISFLVKNVHPETGDLLPEPKVLPFKIKFNH